VYVADREADLMPLMLRAQEVGMPADWLCVRASHNPCLPEGEKLWQYTGAGEGCGANSAGEREAARLFVISAS
jgi:hypothetical protein